jgi:hypothetical protein
MTRSQGGLVSGFNHETVTCIDNLVPSEQLARALGEALESSSADKDTLSRSGLSPRQLTGHQELTIDTDYTL